MAQTHYIEVDEEIISAVGRLRKTGEAENIFVFPKRALILQSIVNLKLLEREARKLGKKIVIVSQDSAGKLLAEKAGLSTQDYNDESQVPRESEPTARFTIEHTQTVSAVPLQDAAVKPLRSASLGSADFFANGKAPRPKAPLPVREPGIAPILLPKTAPVMGPQPKVLRIRNAAPPHQTSLNSLRTTEIEARRPITPALSPSVPQNFVPQANRPRPTQPESNDGTRQEKLRRFMMGAREHFAQPPQFSPPAEPPKSERNFPAPLPEPPTTHSSAATWAFIILGALSAVAIVGALLFMLVPKANVTVIPQGIEQDITYQFIGTKNPSGESDPSKAIPARIVDVEKSVRLSADATGTGSGEIGKAKGTVIISNTYSTESQPLVATTRLSTPDGKIFRLTQGVTVPGMTKGGSGDQPGIIEVSVVADQAGESYNVGPTSFTIPGFQGSQKFEKFTGKSNQNMSGGGSGNTNGPKVVSQSDIDAAKEKAMNEARDNFKTDVLAGLQPGERLFEESVEITPIGTPTVPSVGTVANSFDYQARFRVRGFVISEQSIHTFVDKQSVPDAKNSAVEMKPVSYELKYGTPLANFDAGRVELSVQAKMVLRSTVDTDKLRTELLGQDEKGIRSVLEKHPEIKSVQIEFVPKIFIASIPKDPKRVNIIVGSAAEKP